MVLMVILRQKANTKRETETVGSLPGCAAADFQEGPEKQQLRVVIRLAKDVYGKSRKLW